MKIARPASRNIAIALIALACVGSWALLSGAQVLDIFGNREDKSVAGRPQVRVQLTPANAKPGDEVTLAVTLTVPPGNYTYSMNPEFSGHTRIEISKLNGLSPVEAGFRPDHPPKSVYDDILEQTMEKFHKDVTWSRKYQVLPDAELNQVFIAGKFYGQVCNDRSCRPLRETFQAALVSNSKPTAAGGTETKPASREVHPLKHTVIPARRPGKPEPITLTFQLSPENAQSGDEVTLSITAKPDPEYHIFALSQDPEMAGRPTVIKVETHTGLKPLDEHFQPSQKFETERPEGLPDIVQRVHHGEISWARRFRVADSTQAGELGVSGSFQYQICRNGSCRIPMTVPFNLGIVGISAITSPEPTAVAGEIKSSGDEQSAVLAQDNAAANGALPLYLVYAFLGGLILNVMPCVLPVIAIKVMSFVQQAGESRSRIFTLNLVYSAGVISVFLVLASLAVFASLGWGGLFRSSGFNLIMACVVFAMGLSLLGVFEIPVPGFVGSAAGTNQKEGLFGAFMTGILATLLATPCSGPFLGTTLAWSVRQPTTVTYLTWGTMGFGMACPYLILGMFPAATRWLPKPGNWMVRLKEFAGFVLMGTVIFIIHVLEESLVVPLLVMLLGIALGLWMIGNLYDMTSPIKHKMTVRVSAALLTLLTCAFGFMLSQTAASELPWEPYNQAKLDSSLAKNKTVLIDFTADW